MKQQTKRIVPAFANETQEADWWYANRKLHDRQLRAALKNGEAQVLTKEKLLERIADSKRPRVLVAALNIPCEGKATVDES